jgi:hypothetical protein
MSVSAPAQTTKQRIYELLDDLPSTSLPIVEQFVEFLRQQAQRGQPVVIASIQEAPPYRYPTVALPASSLDTWVNLLPEGYDGDALADTEALYDKV